jgi:uncharacterized protein (DUF302 family)
MRHLVILPVFLSIAFVTACKPAAPPPPTATPPASVVRYSSDASFADVVEDLQHAITAKGLVVDNVSYIGKMLERTGKDIGSTTPIFTDGHAQAFSFCSAALSRKTMEVDPNNIAFCPYTIVVYSPAADPKKVYVAYRRPVLNEGSDASRAALKEVESLLDSIVREALRMPAS